MGSFPSSTQIRQFASQLKNQKEGNSFVNKNFLDEE